jgi:hypothetical protein
MVRSAGRAAAVLLVAHAAVALAIWGPAWWASRARTAAMAVDMNSELAPAKPAVETIGAAGVAAGASEAAPVVPLPSPDRLAKPAGSKPAQVEAG